MSIYLPCLPNSSWSFSQPTSNFETYKSTINLKLGGFNQPFSTIFDAWISMVLRSPTTNENRHGEFSAGFCRRPMGWCRPAVGSGFWMDSWRSREYATQPTEKTDIYYTWVSHVVHRNIRNWMKTWGTGWNRSKLGFPHRFPVDFQHFSTSPIDFWADFCRAPGPLELPFQELFLEVMDSLPTIIRPSPSSVPRRKKNGRKLEVWKWGIKWDKSWYIPTHITTYNIIGWLS